MSMLLFPEVYMHGERPAKYGVAVNLKEIPPLRLSTPAYAYGWVIPNKELYESVREDLHLDYQPFHMDGAIAELLWSRCKTENESYNPSRPKVLDIGEDHVLIFMTGNDSVEMVEAIMADGEYHEMCRDCMNKPKTMMRKPAWFRVGLKSMPKDFMTDDVEDATSESGPTNQRVSSESRSPNHFTTLLLFPEVYMHGERPAKYGVAVNLKDIPPLRLSTPAYAYGWVIPNKELYESVRDDLHLDYQPFHMDGAIAELLWSRCKTENESYNPSRPKVLDIGEDHVLIFMTGNDSVEMMEAIMADGEYHEMCRDCMNKPKTMMRKPAWFRVGLKSMPKDFMTDDVEDAASESGPIRPTNQRVSRATGSESSGSSGSSGSSSGESEASST